MAYTVQYGAYTFATPAPRVGESVEYQHIVPGGGGKAFKTFAVEQEFSDFSGYAAHRARMQLIFTACQTQNQTLYITDGTTVICNQTAWVERVECPPQHGQKTFRYTVVFATLLDPPTFSPAITATLVTAAGTLDMSANPPSYREACSNERPQIKSSVRRQAVTISLHGTYHGANRAGNQAWITSIRSHMAQTTGVLTYGGIALTVYPGTSDIPENIPDTDVEYTLNFLYYVETFSPASATFTYTGPTTLTLTQAVRSESGSVKREQETSDHQGLIVTSTFSGVYYGTDLAGNEAFAASVRAAMRQDSGTLAYGNYSVTAYTNGYSLPDHVTAEGVPWSCTFLYILAPADAPANVEELVVKQSMQPPVAKMVFHDCPYRTGSIPEYLGLSDFTITYTGYVIGTSFANAETAAIGLKADFQSGGYLMPGATLERNEDDRRVDFNMTYRYPVYADIVAAPNWRTPGT